MKYFIYALKNVFNYSGRARRAEFGWFHLTNALLQMGITIGAFILIFGSAFASIGMGINEKAVFASVGIGVLVLYVLVFCYQFFIFLVNLSITTRRLHDLGWSGWWQLVFFLAPLFVAIPMISIIFEQQQMAMQGIEPDLSSSMLVILLSIVLTIAELVIFCILLFKEGQIGANKYGEDPKAEIRAIYAQMREQKAVTTQP